MTCARQRIHHYGKNLAKNCSLMANLIPLAKGHKGLTVGSLNIRSLFNVMDLFRTTFQNSGFHIIGISETWLHQNINSSLISIDNYVLHRQDRNFLNNNNNTKKGGGLCLYIDTNIKTRSLQMNNINISCADIECQWIELCYENQRNIIIGNVYRPPNGDVDNFIDHLENCISNMDLGKKDIIICGDINIDWLEKRSNPTKKLVEFLSQVRLVNFISDPTRYSKTKDSCIDHIYSNSGCILESGVLDVNISDHELVYLVRKKQKTVNVKYEFMGRSYVGYDSDAVNTLLANDTWDDFYNNTDPNRLWNIFKNKILSAIDILCPQTKFEIKKFKEPWLSNEILEFIKDKDRALKKAKRTRTEEDWKIAQSLRNRCLAMVRKTKSDLN